MKGSPATLFLPWELELRGPRLALALLSLVGDGTMCVFMFGYSCTKNVCRSAVVHDVDGRVWR